jgi:hypothetical protein
LFTALGDQGFPKLFFTLPHLPCQRFQSLKLLILKAIQPSVIPAIDRPRQLRDEKRHGRTTVVASPAAEIVHVESAVLAAYVLQPAGATGICARKGPAVCPWAFVATTVSSASAVGT